MAIDVARSEMELFDRPHKVSSPSELVSSSFRVSAAFFGKHVVELLIASVFLSVAAEVLTKLTPEKLLAPFLTLFPLFGYNIFHGVFVFLASMFCVLRLIRSSPAFVATEVRTFREWMAQWILGIPAIVLFLALGLAAGVLPGVYLWFALQLWVLFIAFKNMNVVRAVRSSWRVLHTPMGERKGGILGQNFRSFLAVLLLVWLSQWILEAPLSLLRQVYTNSWVHDVQPSIGSVGEAFGHILWGALYIFIGIFATLLKYNGFTILVSEAALFSGSRRAVQKTDNLS